MSNQLIAAAQPLGTGPKLDAACNPFTGGKQDRTQLAQIYIHLFFWFRTPGQA